MAKCAATVGLMIYPARNNKQLYPKIVNLKKNEWDLRWEILKDIKKKKNAKGFSERRETD